MTNSNTPVTNSNTPVTNSNTPVTNSNTPITNSNAPVTSVESGSSVPPLSGLCSVYKPVDWFKVGVSSIGSGWICPNCNHYQLSGGGGNTSFYTIVDPDDPDFGKQVCMNCNTVHELDMNNPQPIFMNRAGNGVSYYADISFYEVDLPWRVVLPNGSIRSTNNCRDGIFLVLCKYASRTTTVRIYDVEGYPIESEYPYELVGYCNGPGTGTIPYSEEPTKVLFNTTAESGSTGPQTGTSIYDNN